MRSCNCALPSINPDACKNCSNNQQELSEFTKFQQERCSVFSQALSHYSWF